MKKRIAVAMIAALMLMSLMPAANLYAAGTHTVTLTWAASTDGGLYSIYRAAGNCGAAAAFNFSVTGISALTYQDLNMGPGAYCYQVTTVVNGAESVPSNQASAVILPASPGATLALTWK